MESSYQAALHRRERLREELEKVEQYIRLSHELFGAPKPDWIQDDDGKPAAPVSDSNAPDNLVVLSSDENRRARPAVRPPGYARPRDVIRAAKEILTERGRPQTRSELLQAMEARGMVMPGLDKSKSLGTTLWRAKDDFIQLDGHGYWLRGIANALVGYDPRGAFDELLR